MSEIKTKQKKTNVAKKDSSNKSTSNIESAKENFSTINKRKKTKLNKKREKEIKLKEEQEKNRMIGFWGIIGCFFGFIILSMMMAITESTSKNGITNHQAFLGIIGAIFLIAVIIFVLMLITGKIGDPNYRRQFRLSH
jgi:cation transport ATPase